MTHYQEQNQKAKVDKKKQTKAKFWQGQGITCDIGWPDKFNENFCL